MNRSRRWAVGLLAVAGLLAAAPVVRAQSGQPIVVKQPKPKKVKYKGFVIHANRVQITVRSAENERMVRTFRLSEELQEKMQKIIDRGGYQYGDKVEVHYVEGGDLAVKIKGKPSKPPR